MMRVALAGLLRRKLRAALTAIAIVLGVAMIAGTFVLTDSIDQAFNSIFTESPGLRRRRQRQGGLRHQRRNGTQRRRSPGLLAQVRLPEVAEADGSVNGRPS